MTTTSPATCLGCKHATPSETIEGMLWCLENRAATVRGQFGHRLFNFNPNREACSHLAPRKEPLVFTERATSVAPVVAPAPTEPDPFDLFSSAPPAPAPARPVPAPARTPARSPAPPHQVKDGFSKEFFL